MSIYIPRDLILTYRASVIDNIPILVDSNIIAASLRKCLYNDKKEWLNALNKIFLRINFCFIYNKNVKFNKDLKFSNIGIVDIRNQGLCYIYINNKFFELLDTNDNINLISECLFLIYKNYTLDYLFKPLELKNYSEFSTIDFYAKLLSNSLLNKYDNKLEIENLFTSYDGNKKLCDEFEEFKIYYDKFGSGLNLRAKFWTDKMKHDLRILDYFKKRTCDFLLMTDSFFYSEDFRFSLGNIDKLYENLPFNFPSE